ncbi:MAG: type II secretion system protein [Chloroflexi bacterium]|nr:type II secretion system protein [Chloroflexota bacterium]
MNMAGHKPVQGHQKGFTLVELLVVVGIIVALATVSLVSVNQFSGKGQEGAQASEKATLQSAMDTMMADKGITTVTSNSTAAAVNDFTADPVEGPLEPYLRENPTAYYYCWSVTGKITEQGAAAFTCA